MNRVCTCCMCVCVFIDYVQDVCHRIFVLICLNQICISNHEKRKNDIAAVSHCGCEWTFRRCWQLWFSVSHSVCCWHLRVSQRNKSETFSQGLLHNHIPCRSRYGVITSRQNSCVKIKRGYRHISVFHSSILLYKKYHGTHAQWCIFIMFCLNGWSQSTLLVWNVACVFCERASVYVSP